MIALLVFGYLVATFALAVVVGSALRYGRDG